MIVLHIGLGKTATTVMQKHVFPRLAEMRGLSYNSPEAVRLLRKCQDIGLEAADAARAKRVFSPQTDVLISDEGLVNWNPHRWEDSADEILSVTGRDVTVLITVREPVSYLTSMYQQTVRLGEVRRPHQFFVNAAGWAKLKNFRRPGVRGDLDYFDVDSFDLEKLESIYRTRLGGGASCCHRLGGYRKNGFSP